MARCEECPAQHLQPLILGSGQIARDQGRPRDIGRHFRCLGSGEDYCRYQVRMVGRHHPREGLPKGLAEQNRMACAQILDHGGNIIGQVVQRDIRHRPYRPGDAAWLRP